MTEGEIAFWDQQEESIEKPFIYRSTRDAQSLREMYQFALTMACLLIGLFLAESFAGESVKRTDELIYTSRYGQNPTLFAKLTAGTLFSLITGCMTLIAAGAPVLLFSGLHGLDAPWYLVEGLSSITMKAGWILALHTLAFLLGCVLTGMLAMVLSLLFNHVIAAAGTMFALVIIDLFISVPTRFRVLSQVRYLTPLSVLMNTRVQDMRLIKLFGTYLNSYQTAPFIYVLCVVILMIISMPFFHQRCNRR